MDEEQSEWLIGQLEQLRRYGEYGIVLGHHPLRDDLIVDLDSLSEDPQLADVLTDYSNRVIAYLGGHTHVPKIEYLQRRNGLRLVNVTGASYHEYPQMGFLVSVLEKGNELGIDVRPIQASVRGQRSGLRHRQKLACKGSKVDRKKKQAAFESDDDCILAPGQAGLEAFHAPVARGLDSSEWIPARYYQNDLLNHWTSPVQKEGKVLLDGILPRRRLAEFGLSLELTPGAEAVLRDLEVDAPQWGGEKLIPVELYLERLLQLSKPPLDYYYSNGGFIVTKGDEDE